MPFQKFLCILCGFAKAIYTNAVPFIPRIRKICARFYHRVKLSSDLELIVENHGNDCVIIMILVFLLNDIIEIFSYQLFKTNEIVYIIRILLFYKSMRRNNKNNYQK